MIMKYWAVSLASLEDPELTARAFFSGQDGMGRWAHGPAPDAPMRSYSLLSLRERLRGESVAPVKTYPANLPVPPLTLEVWW